MPHSTVPNVPNMPKNSTRLPLFTNRSCATFETAYNDAAIITSISPRSAFGYVDVGVGEGEEEEEEKEGEETRQKVEGQDTTFGFYFELGLVLH